jgi:hypothetical protein
MIYNVGPNIKNCKEVFFKFMHAQDGLEQGFSTFWYSRTPKPNIISEFNILSTPSSFSRTPRGTRTPGWEPLA